MKIRTTIIIICAVFLLAGCATKSARFALDPRLNSDIKLVNGSQYAPLSKFCDLYNLDCKWDTFTRTASINKSGKVILLRSLSDGVLINGNYCRMDRPALIIDGALYVPLSFIRKELSSAIIRAAAPAIPFLPITDRDPGRYSINTIVLDAGHGGKDAGAVSKYRGTREKDMALNIAIKLKKALEEKGLSVKMTRSSDVFIPLPGRSALANRSKADLFISIHINAARSRSLSGFEVYYLSNATDDNSRAIEAFENSALQLGESADLENSSHLSKTLWDMTLTENRAESAELASCVSRAVEMSGIMSRGVKKARFYVLKHTNIPSILIECGYISNKSDEDKLRNPAYQDKLVTAIVLGIMQYKNLYEKTEGFT